jgi:glutamine synthetase
MNTVVEILKYILPALLVLLAVYIPVAYFLRQERWYRTHANIGEQNKEWLKIRLQAYERIMLFLERINPEHLVVRLAGNYTDPLLLQKALLQSIRDEYEHNLVQQLYVSDDVWQALSDARNQISQLVNEAARQTDRQAPAPELAATILQAWMQVKDDPIALAIKTVKKDVRKMMESVSGK